MADPETLWDVLNSEFVKSLTGSAMGALAGAGLGAYAAQYIAERSKVRDELLKEIRNVHAAVAMAYGITDSFINLKQQHVKPIYEKFHAGKVALQKFTDEHKQGAIFKFDVDLLSLPLFPIPTAQLQQILFEKITAPTRAISLINVVVRTLHGLEELFTKRNQLIEAFRSKQDVHPFTYFGMQTPDGADMRYASTIDGISHYTDDMIQFSKMLGDDLSKYGIELKDRLPQKFRATVPMIVDADFSKASDVMPDPEKYRSWETAFVKAVKPVTGLNFWTSTPPDKSV